MKNKKGSDELTTPKLTAYLGGRPSKSIVKDYLLYYYSKVKSLSHKGSDWLIGDIIDF